MSTFKLISFSLLTFVFSLTSFSTTYASILPVENESVTSASISQWVQITAPMNPNIRYLTNIPMTIGAVAGNTTGDLVSLVLLVDGTLVASGTSATLISTYTPTSGGQYLLEAVATYSDGSQVSTQMNFNVMGGGIRQLLVPMQILIP